MTECNLVSCANDIKIWDVNKQTELAAFSPHKSTVNCVRWNHNNQVLVSGGDDGEVVLSHQTGRSLGRLPTDVSRSEPIQALAFSSGSRYLCSAGGAQVVDVWDLKKKEKTRTFSGHTGGVTAVVFGKGDAKVASASESGAILIHTVVTGAQAAALQVTADPIRSIDYSPTEPHMLAAGGDGGNLDLWDTNTSTRLKSWVAHQNTICQVGFAPSGLMCTVGLDTKLLFFDLNTHRLVKQVLTDYPLTCVDFLDGVTLAVGTEGSHILSYDLRKTDSPSQKIMGAHQAPVINCLKFQSQKRPAALSTPGSPSPASRSFSEEPSPEKPFALSPSADHSASRVSPLSSSSSAERPQIAPVGVRASSNPMSPLPSTSLASALSQTDVAFVRSCVDEAMTEVRAGVRADLANLHVELLRQFHQQMIDMKGLLNGFSSEQAALVDEVKKMREMYKLLPSSNP